MGGVFGLGGAGWGQRVNACLCTMGLVYCLDKSRGRLSSGTNPSKTFSPIFFFKEPRLLQWTGAIVKTPFCQTAKSE